MAKETCESHATLSISWLKKIGVFSPESRLRIFKVSWRGPTIATASLAFNDDRTLTLNQMLYGEYATWQIQIQNSPCHLGGERKWFECPKCSRRAGMLYLSRESPACRLCCNLAYESQQRTHTGLMGLMYAVVAYDNFNDRPYPKRTRMWRGRPTQRYARWLQRSQYASRRLTALSINQL